MNNFTDSQIIELLDDVEKIIKDSENMEEAREKVNDFVDDFKKQNSIK